jgi:hypothetical protein
VKGLHFLSQNRHHLIILTSDKYLIYDLHQKQVLKSFRSHKKDKKLAKNPDSIIHQLPQAFGVSPDDRLSVEVHKEVLVVRNLISNQITAKFEGHSSHVKMAAFAYPPADEKRTFAKYAFVSCAGTECLLWEYTPKQSEN